MNDSMEHTAIEDARRCAFALNSLHSLLYFTPDMADALAPFGVADDMDIYLAERAAPLGVVSAPVVVAAFNTFAPRSIVDKVPALWNSIDPPTANLVRLQAAESVLRRLMPPTLLESAELTHAARWAKEAALSGTVPGRALYAANTALPFPEDPLTALWHAATLLREHRGDGHTSVLATYDLTGLDALVLDCASPLGMAKEIVRAKRGWTEDDWSAAEARLIDRELLNAGAELTDTGATLRETIESETTRLDAAPYRVLGAQKTAALGEFASSMVEAGRDAFPAPLDAFFVPDRTTSMTSS